jgi:hydrogenase maturation protein HypF
MAIALLYELHGADLFRHRFPCCERVAGPERDLFLRMLERGINSPLTSSCGRLFDGVAALLGVREVMSYEGQAAIELEGLAERGLPGAPFPLPTVATAAGLELDWRPLLATLTGELLAGRPAADLAATFHLSLAEGAARLCREVATATGLDRVVLSGGVFQNRLLAETLATRLEQEGLTVCCHRLVPPNDGGLALGQAMIAGRSQLCA